MSAIDNHFDKNDMELNLAVKINVWKELKDNQNIIVGKDEIKDILTAYGKYRDKNN